MEIGTERLRVRDAALRDRPAIEALLRSRWGETVVSRGRVHLPAELPALLAERDGALLGCLTYRFDGASIEVVTLDAVVERQGVASALMHAIRPRSKRIWLVSTNDNLPAQALYAKLGMRLVAVHRGAIAESRRLKPSIPLLGIGGVPIADELEYEW